MLKFAQLKQKTSFSVWYKKALNFSLWLRWME